jgi:hypothetical protein
MADNERVRIRLQPWQLAVFVVVLSCGFVSAVRWWKNSFSYDRAHMVAALPGDRATVFFADVAALRNAGILDLLAGSKAAEEADYQKFVEQIGFDYRTDLDTVAAAFVDGQSFFTVRGRFQWSQLADYAKAQGGECRYAICTLPGSSLGRNISFYPMQPNVLALAVTPEPNGVSSITPSSHVWLNPLPPEPVWISAPTSELTKPGALPVSIQVLLGPAARSGRVVAALGPRNQGIQLRLSLVCKSPDEAQTVKRELASATEIVRNSLQNDSPEPGQPDWAGFLRGGTLSVNGAEVTGTWPLDRSFLNALVSDAR